MSQPQRYGGGQSQNINSQFTRMDLNAQGEYQDYEPSYDPNNDPNYDPNYEPNNDPNYDPNYSQGYQNPQQHEYNDQPAQSYGGQTQYDNGQYQDQPNSSQPSTQPHPDSYHQQHDHQSQSSEYYDQAAHNQPRRPIPQALMAIGTNRPLDPTQASSLASPIPLPAAESPSSIPSAKSSPRIAKEQIPRPSKDSGDPGSDILVYHTRSGAIPPPATTQYQAIDEGNCIPRFMRLTTTQIPHASELVDSTRICIGAIIQPLANVGLEEEPVPLVDPGKDGPMRCCRCRCYVNPYFKFIDDGKHFICNMCSMKNEVPHDYICNLDGDGHRRDKYERFELCRGSCEFVASKEYITKPIQDPCYLFVIDVSYPSVVSGLLSVAIGSIMSSLDTLAANPRVRVGIITFDDQVHFYNLKSRVEEPEILVVGDLENIFVPVPSSELLVHISEEQPDSQREALENLLSLLPELYENTTVESNCFGSAVQAAEEILADFGGKMILIHSSLATKGLGVLQNRDDVSKYGTEKEGELFKPQTSFYEVLATRCAEFRISIDLFSCPNTYVDLSTIGHLCKTTAGQIFFYPGFNSKKDGEAFHYDMFHDLTRSTGFDGVMICRASRGLRVTDQYGSFFIRQAHEMELPSIDCDKAFAIRLEHDDVLEDKSEACLQCALLYTTFSGQRRIRVHTISYPVTSVLGTLFRHTDLDAIVNLSLKQAVYVSPTTNFGASRVALVQACVDILYTYRKYCAHASSSGQLILPESLKLLPLYTLGLIKSPVLADKQRVDDRAFLFSYVMSMPCCLSVPFVYPRLYSLHDLANHECVLGKSNNVIRPDPKELSREQISTTGLYLLDNGRHLFLSVGHDLNRETVGDVFGLEGDQKIDASQLYLVEPPEDDPYHIASRIRLFIDELRYDRPNFPPLTIMEKVIKRSSSTPSSLDETAFLGYLIDDGAQDPQGRKKDAKSIEHMSYVDFLCHVHRRIQDRFM